jgi:hypothetical protein
MEGVEQDMNSRGLVYHSISIARVNCICGWNHASKICANPRLLAALRRFNSRGADNFRNLPFRSALRTCLQRTGVLLAPSPLYWFPMFSTIWGICFSPKAKPNAMKTYDSHTVRAQSDTEKSFRARLVSGESWSAVLISKPATYFATFWDRRR